MTLASPDGTPVPENDPRIPRPSMIEAERTTADTLKEACRGIPGVRLQEAEMAARLDALISLVVPPDGDARAIFDFRVQENRGANFARVIEAYQAMKAEAEKPRLEIVQGVSVPR